MGRVSKDLEHPNVKCNLESSFRWYPQSSSFPFGGIVVWALASPAANQTGFGFIHIYWFLINKSFSIVWSSKKKKKILDGHKEIGLVATTNPVEQGLALQLICKQGK